MKKRVLFGILSVMMAAVLSLTGCGGGNGTPVNGASQEKYLFGTYSATFTSTLMMLDKAVRETCKAERLTEVQRVNRVNSCYYHYKDINGMSLRISLEEGKNNTVRIKMKVGSTGSKEDCQKLLQEIDQQLRSQGSLL